MSLIVLNKWRSSWTFRETKSDREQAQIDIKKVTKIFMNDLKTAKNGISLKQNEAFESDKAFCLSF